MAGIVFVRAADAYARELFEAEGRAYWTAALPLVLEKHGLLEFDVVGPEILEDPARLAAYDVALIGELPARAWTEAVRQGLAESGIPALFETPAPAWLLDELGVSAAEAPPEGSLSVTGETLRANGERYGTTPGGRLRMPQTHESVDRVEGMHWSEIGVPISDRQAYIWRACGWRAENWQADGADTVAWWIPDDDPESRSAAVVRRDNWLATSFGLFAFLGQCHTAEPFDKTEYRSWGRTFAVEALLLGLIDELYTLAGAQRTRVLPWPRGADWVLSVRHDFDRDIGPDEVAEVVDRHRKAGTSATWYWRSRYVDPRGERTRRRGVRRRQVTKQSTKADIGRGRAAMALVAEAADHEVALHTERMWAGGEAEKRALEQAFGDTMAGSSAHGDPNCFRYQGAPNLLWAEREGLEYTEFLQHAHFHPHRPATLEPDGTIRELEVICLSHHESFDRSMKQGDTATETLSRAISTYVRANGMLQVLNHPDLNQDELFALLESMPRDSRLDWTAAQTADWWRRTHLRAQLQLETLSDSRVRVSARSEVAGVVLEVRFPDDKRRRFALYLEAGKPVVFGPGERVLDEQGVRDEGAGLWAALEPRFADAVTAYYVAQGHSPSDPAIESTIKTNTALVPERAEIVLTPLREQLPTGSLRGLRVLEAGSGFGALAAYLATFESPARVLGIDTRDDFVAAARDAAGDVPGLDYAVGDMRALLDEPDGSFEVIIANNALLYLAHKGDMEAALGEFARLLTPGGSLLIHQANRWRGRDPFSRTPLVHLVGRRSARLLAAIFRGSHNHGRIRLVGPPRMRRMLRAAGFENPRLAAPGARPKARFRGRLSGYFIAFATKPR